MRDLLTNDKSSRNPSRATVRPPLRPTYALSLPKCSVKQVTYDVKNQHIGKYSLMHHKVSLSPNENEETTSFICFISPILH